MFVMKHDDDDLLWKIASIPEIYVIISGKYSSLKDFRLSDVNNQQQQKTIRETGTNNTLITFFYRVVLHLFSFIHCM